MASTAFVWALESGKRHTMFSSLDFSRSAAPTTLLSGAVLLTFLNNIEELRHFSLLQSRSRRLYPEPEAFFLDTSTPVRQISSFKYIQIPHPEQRSQQQPPSPRHQSFGQQTYTINSKYQAYRPLMRGNGSLQRSLSLITTQTPNNTPDLPPTEQVPAFRRPDPSPFPRLYNNSS